METLANPMIMCDLPRVPLRNKKGSWETLLTGKVVISEEGRLTIATTTTFRNQAGQVVREEEHILPRATLWVGGLHAFLQHAIRLSFFKREVSEANFKLFALAFQTIYDAAAKRAHNSTRCVIHYATGNSEEDGATLKLTHRETAFQKFRAVTGLEPSRVLAPAGRGPVDRGYPRHNQRELLPNDLGNRGSPIAGINDAFFIPFHDPERTPSCLSRGHRLSLRPLAKGQGTLL